MIGLVGVTAGTLFPAAQKLESIKREMVKYAEGEILKAARA
jgi:hypothetical protein